MTGTHHNAMPVRRATSAGRVLMALWLALLLQAAGCSGGGGLGDAGAAAPALAATADGALNILVIGGTSGIGLETVRLAVQRGHAVTALARRPERMPLADERLQTFAGDILDADSLREHIAAADAVVIAIGMGPTREAVTLFSAGTQNVLALMRESGRKRLVAVTGIGAGDTRGHGGFFYDRILWPLALKTIYEDKDRQEALIRGSGDIEWTIVRPGFLVDAPARGNYRVVEDMSGLTAGDITRADVGHFIVAALENNSFLGDTVLISE